jgi:ribosomal protein S18 acetylase RimI-like enzyme
MNLNEQIHRIKNLMYEQPQVQIVYKGDLDGYFGKNIELTSPDNNTIGFIHISKMNDGENLDLDFNTLYDESKFQTIPLNYDNCLFMHTLEVDENHRKQGHGSHLLDLAHEFAKNNGYNYLSFISDNDNEIANNIYQKRGYKSLNSNDNSSFYFVEL